MWMIYLNFADRYRQYLISTMPIIEKYDQRGLVRRISATPPPEQVRQCHSVVEHAKWFKHDQ